MLDETPEPPPSRPESAADTARSADVGSASDRHRAPGGTPTPAPTRTPVPGARRPRPTLGALTREALWLGATGFGGGLAVLAGIRDLLVVRRRWLTEREFDVTATVSQMLPGGAAANALAYTGMRFFGTAGAVAAYLAFIAPGTLLVLGLAAAYVHLGVAPRFEPFLAGLNAAVVGLIASITLQMVRTGVARGWQMGVAAGALLLSFGGGASAGEVAGLGIAAGLVLDLLWKRMRLSRVRRTAKPARRSPPVALPDEGEPLRPPPREADAEPPSPRAPLLAVVPPLVFGPAGLGALGGLALLFFRAGLGAYGGGFAIISSLHATVVAHGWVDERQFTDAVAIGKLTPGPVLLMATFMGYAAKGLVGAAVATVGVFSGPLLLVLGVSAWLARVRSRRPVRAALRGLTPAVVGLMAGAALTLGQSLHGTAEVALAAASLLTLSRFRVSPVLVMFAGGLARLGLRAVGI